MAPLVFPKEIHCPRCKSAKLLYSFRRLGKGDDEPDRLWTCLECKFKWDEVWRNAVMAKRSGGRQCPRCGGKSVYDWYKVKAEIVEADCWACQWGGKPEERRTEEMTKELGEKLVVVSKVILERIKDSTILDTIVLADIEDTLERLVGMAEDKKAIARVSEDGGG